MAESTCWTIIRGAAAGGAAEQEAFARTYEPVARAYLAARWRRGPMASDVDDAVQEVFLACFRDGGVLARVDGARPFRPFLYGVLRNVARRFESRVQRRREAPVSRVGDLPADVPTLSAVFDRAWALALLERAVQAHRRRATTDAARRRVEVLRLRFEDGMPIRAIAAAWGVAPARVHKDYAAAREEFRAVLAEVVAFHEPRGDGRVERECSRLLGLFR